MDLIDHTLAVDFGTSNSSVYLKKNKLEALCDQTGSYLFPSFVEYTKTNIVTGFAAKRNLGKSGKFVVASVKRLIGLTYEEYEQLEEKNIFGCEIVQGDDGFPRFIVSNNNKLVSCIEVACELFKNIKERAEIYCEPRKFDYLYLTVPADYKPNQCDAICKAAELAGFKVKKMIAEPSAAALSYLLDSKDTIGPKEKILVYDFGGGTFDASLLTYSPSKGISILGEEGDDCLGGNDVDMEILRYITEVTEKKHGELLIPPSHRAFRKFTLLKSICEAAKEALYSCSSYEVVLDEVNSNFDPITFFPATLDFCIYNIIEKTVNCVKKVIEDNHLSPGNIRHVFLVGGSSKLKCIRKALQEFLGDQCNFPEIDPQHCVAYGAMKLLVKDALNQEQHLVTSLSASYGLEINDQEVLLMLKKGSKVPLTSCRYTFKTTIDFQENVSMKIYQYSKVVENKEKNLIVKKENCSAIFDLVFQLSPQHSAGNYFVDIEFSFDIGGVLTVYCYDHTHNQLLYKCNYNPIHGSY